MTKTRDEAKGKCEAQIISVDAKNTCNKSLAAKMLEIADLKAQTIDIIGKGEGQIAKVMQSRRKYEYLNGKMEVIAGFKDNKNLKIFGNNQDDALAQMAAYRINQKSDGAI